MNTFRKHIIVEGMDGSGKDWLIRDLMDLTMGEFVIHERASTSLGGPVARVDQWVLDDLGKMESQPASIYNRHPLISEPIYAPIRKVNPGLRGHWRNLTWIKQNSRLVANHCVLVICHLPLPHIKEYLQQSEVGHMPGVIEAAEYLHQAYSQFVWAGPTIRYNHHTTAPDHLLRSVQSFLGRRASKDDS